ncbi:MAG TPA: DUF4332 domain-containing protein [Candidatus Thermoplasmatota archaeon]|nr:DUF4332 domain-containing protein [Candidatus Thermoplasmatota archaeon]
MALVDRRADDETGRREGVGNGERERYGSRERGEREGDAADAGVWTWLVGIAGGLVAVAGLVAAVLVFAGGEAAGASNVTILAALAVATAVIAGGGLVVAAVVLGRYARATSIADALERRLDESVPRHAVARSVLDRSFDARFAALEAGAADLPAIRSAVADLDSRATEAGRALSGGDEGASEEGEALRRIPTSALAGVTDAQVRRYRDAGVRTTWELAASDPSDLSRRADVPESTVRRHQAMAELLTLDDVEPEDAATLVAAGVTSVEELAGSDPDRLADAIAETPAPSGASTIYMRDVEAWVEGARRERARLSRRTEVPAGVERP